MSIKVGINGLGRMGRLVLRVAWAWPDIEFVRFNDPAGDAETFAHLMNFDSVHGRWSSEASGEGDQWLNIDGKKVAFSRHSSIADTDW